MGDLGEEEESEFWKNLDGYIVKLKDEDKAARRATLKTIYTAVQHADSFNPSYKLDNDPRAQGENTAQASVNVVETQLAMFIRPVICCASIDTSETCREIAYDILGEIFERLCNQRGAEYLPKVIPPLREKFGKSEINETCEEVRLAGYKFLSRLLAHLPEYIDPCVGDLIPICINGLLDAFVEIKVVTCSIISKIAQHGRQNFYNTADKMAPAMGTTMSHAQQRVRKAIIQCVGPVVLHGHHKCFEAIYPSFALRKFEHIPDVRRAFVETTGNLMLDYNDRYSCFHKLIPLLLSGYLDRNPEVAEVAKSYWIRAGEKFLFENGEEYKNEVDFPLLVGRAGGTPPTIGCKILAAQNIGKLLPSIKQDIGEWHLDKRHKSIELLYCLMFNCEENIAMHINEILDCLVKGALDDDTIVKEYVEKCSELLGIYVQFPTIWPLLKSEIEQISNAGRHFAFLRLTAGILRAANPYTLDPYRKQIGLLIYQRAICQTREERKQFAIIDICAALLSPEHTLGVNEIDHELFYVLMSVSALTESQHLMKKVAGLTRKLVSVLRLPTIEELMGIYFKPILQEMRRSSGHWTRDCPDKLMFELLCQHGGLAAQDNWDDILDIMVRNLGPGQDPKVRLDLFTKLSVHLSENKTKSNRSTINLENEKMFQALIKDVLDPNMTWQAGETASALRVAALGTLHAILEGNYICGKLLDPITAQIMSNLLPLLDESMEIARLMVCQVIEMVMKECGNQGVEILHKVYPVLIKRLDDSSAKVRIAACNAITALFLHTSLDYGTQFAGHLQYVYSILVLHLDDDDDDVRKSVSGTLNNIGHCNPTSLVQECEKIRDKLRSPSLCNEIIQKYKPREAGDGGGDGNQPKGR